MKINEKGLLVISIFKTWYCRCCTFIFFSFSGYVLFVTMSTVLLGLENCVVKRATCSYTGPQHPHSSSHVSLTPVPENPAPFLTSTGTHVEHKHQFKNIINHFLRNSVIYVPILPIDVYITLSILKFIL